MAMQAAATDQLYALESPLQVSPGDTVYEIVRYGRSESAVKHRPMRVQRVERAACLLEADNGMTIKMPFKRLRCTVPAPERKVQLTVVEPASAPDPLPADDPLTAWLEMGATLLDELRAKREQLITAQLAAEGETTHVVDTWQARITELESELRAARQEMERERERGRAKQHEIQQQIAALEARATRVRETLTSHGYQAS